MQLVLKSTLLRIYKLQENVSKTVKKCFANILYFKNVYVLGNVMKVPFYLDFLTL